MVDDGAVTMADVAARSGVSTATVSRALRGARGVSPATRRRIEEVAADLAYVVSPEASNLAGGATGRVAVLVHALDSWYSCAVLAGIQGALARADLDLLLYSVESGQDRRRFFERLPARRKVDALVVVAIPLTGAERERLDVMGVDVVVAGALDDVYPSVHIDDELAARQAVNHLISLGHRRIALLNTVSIEGTAWQSHADRHRGYVRAMTEAGLEVDDELVVSLLTGEAGGALGMDRLLSSSQVPTAVFAFSDEVAIGAVRSLRRARLRIPDDVSVVGLDDHPMAALTDLTTVRQDPRELGALAGQMVVDLLEAGTRPPTARRPTHLVVRGTSAPPRPAPAAPRPGERGDQRTGERKPLRTVDAES